MTEKLGMLEAARLTIAIAAPAARMVLSISPVEQRGREHLSIDVALIETETLPERSKPRGAEPPGPAHDSQEDVYGENGERMPPCPSPATRYSPARRRSRALR
jgi:hypothetical protein